MALVSHLADAGLLLVRQQAASDLEIPMATISADGAEAPHRIIKFTPIDRRAFIGGSDARIIMGTDQEDLTRLWREKRGELAPHDFSRNLIVQLGTVTE